MKSKLTLELQADTNSKMNVKTNALQALSKLQPATLMAMHKLLSNANEEKVVKLLNNPMAKSMVK